MSTEAILLVAVVIADVIAGGAVFLLGRSWAREERHHSRINRLRTDLTRANSEINRLRGMMRAQVDQRRLAALADPTVLMDHVTFRPYSRRSS